MTAKTYFFVLDLTFLVEKLLLATLFDKSVSFSGKLALT